MGMSNEKEEEFSAAMVYDPFDRRKPVNGLGTIPNNLGDFLEPHTTLSPKDAARRILELPDDWDLVPGKTVGDTWSVTDGIVADGGGDVLTEPTTGSEYSNPTCEECGSLMSYVGGGAHLFLDPPIHKSHYRCENGHILIQQHSLK